MALVLHSFQLVLHLTVATAQLDLPPIAPRKSVLPHGNVAAAKAKVLPNSYAVRIIGSEEADDEDRSDIEPNGNSDSTDFDRDRSLRYGPPYTNENSRQSNRNGNANDDNILNHHFADNLYNRSYSVYSNDRRYYGNQNPYTNGNGDDERYYANRNRYPNGDDEKYYAQRDRDHRNDYNYNTDDDRYYANRDSPRDPYYRNENDRGRYGGQYGDDRYNPQVGKLLINCEIRANRLTVVSVSA